jgi:uncharacterized protein YecE (DUF72 family)
MDFGRLSLQELNNINFSLPQEPQQPSALFNLHAKSLIRLGSTSWGKKDWLGSAYPTHARQKDFLHYYSQVCKAIEFNTTYYQIPSIDQIKNWKEQVVEDFHFCPKLTGQITHMRRLKNSKDILNRFIGAVVHFENNLGPILIVLHPGMGPSTLSTIDEFLQQIPEDLRVALEFRHADWFLPENITRLKDVLHKHKAGFVITDTAGRRDCLHLQLTANFCFIRFAGYSLHPSDSVRLALWAEKIKTWQDKGLENVYFFIHQPEDVLVKESLTAFSAQLTSLGVTHMPDFNTYKKQMLF